MLLDHPRPLDSLAKIPLLHSQALQYAQFESWSCCYCKWILVATYLNQLVGLSVFWESHSFKTVMNHHGSTCILRLLLAQLGFFGDVENLVLPDRLVIAFKDFKAWCKQNKIQSSQPMFTVGSATLLDFWTSSDFF